MNKKIVSILVMTLLISTIIPAVGLMNDFNSDHMPSDITQDISFRGWNEIQKLLASDGTTDDLFGRSVSIYGDTALIGVTGDDDNGDYSGSAYVFTCDGASWTQQAKLTSSDGATDDFFGRSVSLYGDTALIGAIGSDDNGDVSGSAYVFTRDGTSWTQQVKLLASDGAFGDIFGWSVSLYGDTALIGAYGDDDNGDDSGSAYMFNYSDLIFIQLKIGWNLLGWYHDYDTTASSLSENISGCVSVSMWNSSLQTYNTYIVGGPPSFDFPIRCSMGLFVDVIAPSIWYGEG